MATLYSRSVKFLKLAWVQQPVLFVSSVIGALGPLIVFLSPLSERAVKATQDIPMKYPYPIADEQANVKSEATT